LILTRLNFIQTAHLSLVIALQIALKPKVIDFYPELPFFVSLGSLTVSQMI